MGVFEINFEEYINPLTYDEHSKLEYYTCTELPSVTKGLSLDDTSNLDNFVVGYNYYSTALPKEVVILSFTDSMTWTDGGGVVTIPPSFVPDKLQDVSTGLELTYPYTKDVSLLGSIYTFNDNTPLITFEFYCTESNKIIAKRERVLEYYIIDKFGNIGPVKQTKLVILETP